MKSYSLPRLMAAMCFGSALAAQTTPEPERFQRLPERPVDLARDRNLFVVGYSHLDTQWRWTYPQVVREYLAATLRENFERIATYPNYLFNFTGSRRYEMMAEYYPAEFARMKTLIAAGRWYPAGSSVDEADTMVPSAESLLRHVLYGNRYFQREFGLHSDDFLLPDCFGFPQGLPTILAHAGVKGFSTQKLTWGSAVGIPFKVGVWEGPDGSAVTAALDPGGYVSLVKEDLSRSESWLARINATGAASGAYVDYHYFGTGDKGGAPADSSVRWIERSLAGTGPVRVISSRADQLFKDLTPAQTARLPHYKGELLLTQHSAGSITSQAYMKRWNRKNELLADATERAAVAAAWLGAITYPSDTLYQAWDLVLGSQMHDMLPGTSMPKAYEYCWNDELLAANLFSATLRDAVGGVAASLDTRAEGVAVVVYNPLSLAREDVVEATVELPAIAAGGMVVIGPHGVPVPAQILRTDGRRVTVAFLAKLGPVGFASFDVRPAATPPPPVTGELTVSEHGLENARYRVAINASGDVASIYDREAKREVLSGPTRLAFLTERPAQFPAWNMDWADREKAPRAFVAGPAKIRVVERGPVRVAVEIEREAEGSRFVQVVRLSAGEAGDRVDFTTKIDWQTPESSLKATFPLAVANPQATYDSQVGTVRRGNNDAKKYEVPQHQWFDLSAPGGNFGVAVLNDSKFGSDKPDDHTMRLTLLYTPGVRTQYQDQASQDFGRHDMSYAIASHTSGWREAQVPWKAARLNQPLLAFQVASHGGTLGRTFSLLTVSNPHVAVRAVKRAEEGDDVVVRLQELSGSPQQAVTLQVGKAIISAREIDGQERPLRDVEVRNGTLVFDVPGYGFRSFALTRGPAGTPRSSSGSVPVPLTFDTDVISTNAKRADGAFDSAGRTYPAEQLPQRLVRDGVEFVLGPTGENRPNAVTAKGQTVSLPAGEFDALYVLAAAEGDVVAPVSVDGRSVDVSFQDWSGFIGQWDNRRWHGEVPEWGYAWFNRLAGLDPGYVKPAEVAWYASHRHAPTGDTYYDYCYLFKHRIPLRSGAKTLTLPNNPKVRIFAVSLAREAHDAVVAATPLFDRLEDRVAQPPRISPAGGVRNDTTQVTLTPPLYWREGGLHYTLDGSEPTAKAPVYGGPFYVDRDTIVKAAEIRSGGEVGAVATVRFTVNDETPPVILRGAALAGGREVLLRFSEPLDPATANDPANYVVTGNPVRSAKQLADRMTVVLTLAAEIQDAIAVETRGIADASPKHSRLATQAMTIPANRAVVAPAAAASKAETTAPGLPVGKGAPWTMNTWVRSDAPVENRTLIAGFGRCDDKVDGTGRYFAVFGNGLHVWGRRAAHLESTVQVDLKEWHMLTATYDGTTLRLLIDGREASWVEASLAEDEPIVRLAPLDPWDGERRFGGEIRQFAIWPQVLSADAIALLSHMGPE